MAAQWGNLRRLITETEIEIRKNPNAKFVGVEAYEEAGGLIRRDLTLGGLLHYGNSLARCVKSIEQPKQQEQQTKVFVSIYSSIGWAIGSATRRVNVLADDDRVVHSTPSTRMSAVIE